MTAMTSDCMTVEKARRERPDIKWGEYKGHVFPQELIDSGRIHLIPRPRHKWHDVMVCDCGTTFLIHPKRLI